MTDNTQAVHTTPTLVVGGTGKTGRRVAQRLSDRGLPVRIGSRSAQPPFDWQDPQTWRPALDGAGSVYLTYFPDLAYPGAGEVIAGFADLAAEQGIRRLVLLSGRGEPVAQHCEQVVLSRNPDATVVRAGMFYQNFSEFFLLDPVISGVVAFPAGEMADPFADVEDIADIVVAALTGDGHAGQIYEVTGPRLLTFAEAVREIAEASGREVTYQPVSPEEYAEGLLAHALVPPEYADFLGDLFRMVFDGRNAHLTDGVQRALGRAPRDFSDYARDAAATGVWAGR